MSLDLGNTPVGTPPNNTQKAQILSVLGAESSSNGSSDIAVDIASSTKFPRISALVSWLNGSFSSLSHKSRHSVGGADAISPSDIGAKTLPWKRSGCVAAYHSDSTTVVGGKITAWQDLSGHNNTLTPQTANNAATWTPTGADPTAAGDAIMAKILIRAML